MSITARWCSSLSVHLGIGRRGFNTFVATMPKALEKVFTVSCFALS